jgi:hypothetical protein
MVVASGGVKRKRTNTPASESSSRSRAIDCKWVLLDGRK